MANKTYTLSEAKGKYHGDTILVRAENAIEAMKKAGMTCWIRDYERFKEMYFGKIYVVYETEKPWYIEYICHE